MELSGSSANLGSMNLWVPSPALHKPSRVVHPCEPSSREFKARGSEFKVIFNYGRSLKIAWVTQDPFSKQIKQSNNKTSKQSNGSKTEQIRYPY